MVQLPYPHPSIPHAIPGQIEVEHFDTGGATVAYQDATDGNQGNDDVRTGTHVDLSVCQDTGGGANLGYTAADEWLEYTVTIIGGSYELDLRRASGVVAVASGWIVMARTSGPIALAATGGWQSWQTHTTSGIILPAGDHVLRLSILAAGSNLNWFALRRIEGDLNRTVVIRVLPLRVDAEVEHVNSGRTEPLRVDGATFDALDLTTGNIFSIYDTPSARPNGSGFGYLNRQVG